MKKIGEQSQDKVKQVCAQQQVLLQEVEREHQTLLETATSAAMEKASQSERELQVQRASLKVLTLSHDEKIEKLKKSHGKELSELQAKIKSLQKIVSGNNETIKKRNNKIKGLKEEVSRRLRESEKESKTLEEKLLKTSNDLETIKGDHAAIIQRMCSDHTNEVAKLNETCKKFLSSKESLKARLEKKLSASLDATRRIQQLSSKSKLRVMQTKSIFVHFLAWRQCHLESKYTTLLQAKTREGRTLEEKLKKANEEACKMNTDCKRKHESFEKKKFSAD